MGGDCESNPEDQTCYVKGARNISGTHTLNHLHTTTTLPDLLNPEMTEEDTRTIEAATEAAVREEQVEAKENEAKKEESKKSNLSTFWLIVIITCSSIIGICCLASC